VRENDKQGMLLGFETTGILAWHISQSDSVSQLMPVRPLLARISSQIRHG